MPRLLIPLLLLILPATLVSGQTTSQDEAARVEFFEKKIRPILSSNCYTCHSANTNSQGGLRLDDRNGMVHGGGRGPAIVPGQPEKSLLLRAVRHTEGKLKMPPNKKLTEEQVAHLTKWIKDGAAWPAVRLPFAFGKPHPKYDRLRKEHWAWQPLHASLPPSVNDSAWACSDIDLFLLRKLQDVWLKPVGDADRLALIRRVTFDLTGLPPTIEDVDAFLADATGQAFARVVDRLLASPAFGERWGRHWLDIARYGESTGSARNLPYPHAWRYRDYVIDAFNKDKPYDQFLREQIAGDLLPAPSIQEKDEHLIATGFLALGVKDVNQRFKVRFVMDNIDEQIDTVCRSVLALTAGCARCHDHKFDPIPTTDYYALAGIFHSTDLCSGLRNKMGGGGLDYYDPAMLLVLGPKKGPDPTLPARVTEKKAELAQARSALVALRDDPTKNESGAKGDKKLAAARAHINKIQRELMDLTDPAVTGSVAFGVRDATVIGDTAIRIRGEAEQLGPVVPRGFLSVIGLPSPKFSDKQSGRLELAKWLTDPRNPLPARVMGNRVWQHLFGQGLVTSVDNFGVTGDRPSHPELLDYLATELIRDGWSVKKLIRKVVLSRAYQLGSATPPAHIAIDPANRLVWRHSPRRLDAEEIRDATLAAAGTLDHGRPSASPGAAFKVIELTNNSPGARGLIDHAAASRHRSVYLPLLRTLTPQALQVFDFAEQGMVTGSRDSTTVASQALYFLNDPFVRGQAAAIADRLSRRTDLDDASRLQLAYRLTLGRRATAKEVERARAYLAECEREGVKAAWASYCQALLGCAEFRYVP